MSTKRSMRMIKQSVLVLAVSGWLTACGSTPPSHPQPTATETPLPVCELTHTPMAPDACKALTEAFHYEVPPGGFNPNSRLFGNEGAK